MGVHHIGDLITTWQTQNPTSPRLTWYGAGGERVELSGRVLSNWAIKAANLLIEEADADADAVVGIDLPVHWRALVWALGGWISGAQVRFGVPFTGEEADAGPLDTPRALITDRPDTGRDADVVVAVTLPALAMTFGGDLPAGAIDGAADLMTYPDVLMQPAARTDVRAMADPATAVEPSARILLPVAGRAGAQILAQTMAAWLAGGSVVLVADAGADPAHLAQVEGAQIR